MSESSSSSSGGIGVLGLLGVAFVVLKLTGFIDWSWWYVTMPFWAGLAIAALILVMAVITFIFGLLINAVTKNHATKRGTK